MQVWKTKRPSNLLTYNLLEGLLKYSRRGYSNYFQLYLNKTYMH